jgi:TRAP-type C4-dicarboxylate transport system substrate-binding protein
MMKSKNWVVTCALVISFVVTTTASASADKIKLRIGSGHPTGVVYAGLMQNYFQPMVADRVAAETDHEIQWIEGYSGSIVKNTEVLEGVQNGIVDIGGMCYCFEPSNLPLHAFQVMLPFGTMNPITSLRIAQKVYAQEPYLTDVFEDKFDQVLLARITDQGYNLGTTFPWTDLSELEGEKIAGAGLNLNWLEYAGITPVQGTLTEAYTGLATNLYEGWVMFPSAWVNLKLYEHGDHYTLIGFGAMTWHGLTINKDTHDRLPEDVLQIIKESALEYEEKVGIFNHKQYPEYLNTLEEEITVTELSAEVRAAWAESLRDWPQSVATDLDAKGLPAIRVLNLALDAAEAQGYKWPVRYEVK